MLFTEDAKQKFTDASLKICNYAALIGLESYLGAPSFVRHFDVSLELNNEDGFDTDDQIKWIIDACVMLSGNIFLFIRDELDDEVMMDYLTRNIPTILYLKCVLGNKQLTHFAVNIESSVDCKFTILTLRFLALPILYLPCVA